MNNLEELVCRLHILRLLTNQRETILADLINSVVDLRSELQSQQAILSTHNAVDSVKFAKQNESIVSSEFYRQNTLSISFPRS